MTKVSRVIITTMYINDYRVPFFNRLRELLADKGVELQLLAGKPSTEEAKKKDQASPGWEISIPCRYFFKGRVCWFPFGAYAKKADLTIVTQENKLIYNLWLLSAGRPKRIAFWGHGGNLQAKKPNGFKERFKSWTINKVDWWFAYTEMSAGLVRKAGFPPERTTVVNNAVDTGNLAALCKQVRSDDCRRMRQQLGLTEGPVGLYLGSLQKSKRLDFFLDAVERIHEQVRTFQLVIVGAGPDQAQIETAARRHAWIHYPGPLHGLDKAKVLMLSDVLLNPGMVGLGILDSFVSGTPLFTTECGIHSPEIAYLESGMNGVSTADDVEAYSDAVISALMDPQTLSSLRVGALASAGSYSIERMAQRFSAGICACLSSRENTGSHIAETKVESVQIK